MEKVTFEIDTIWKLHFGRALCRLCDPISTLALFYSWIYIDFSPFYIIKLARLYSCKSELYCIWYASFKSNCPFSSFCTGMPILIGNAYVWSLPPLLQNCVRVLPSMITIYYKTGNYCSKRQRLNASASLLQIKWAWISSSTGWELQ